MLIVGIFFFSTALLGAPLVIYNKKLEYNTHTHKKKKTRSKKNPKGVGATGLTSHARHRPHHEAPPLFYPNMAFKSVLTFSRIIFEVELFELRDPEPGYNHFLLFCFVLLSVQSVIFNSQNGRVIVYFS